MFLLNYFFIVFILSQSVFVSPLKEKKNLLIDDVALLDVISDDGFDIENSKQFLSAPSYRPLLRPHSEKRRKINRKRNESFSEDVVVFKKESDNFKKCNSTEFYKCHNIYQNKSYVNLCDDLVEIYCDIFYIQYELELYDLIKYRMFSYKIPKFMSTRITKMLNVLFRFPLFDEMEMMNNTKNSNDTNMNVWIDDLSNSTNSFNFTDSFNLTNITDINYMKNTSDPPFNIDESTTTEMTTTDNIYHRMREKNNNISPMLSFENYGFNRQANINYETRYLNRINCTIIN